MLDNFFITGPTPGQMMRGSYNLSYVLLSYLVAALASYLALALARRLVNPKNADRKRLLLWGGALALGAGIWSMHFIGMLAFKMDMPVDYDPWLTIASLFIAIISAYGVLAIVIKPKLRTTEIFGGAVLLGIGISLMHYTGMSAMLMDADMLYRPDLFAASVTIAMAASGTALWIASKLAHYHSKYRHYIKLCASLIMAAAICGMHYMGMAAAVFVPRKEIIFEANGITSNGIMLGVGFVGTMLCSVLPVAVYKSMHDDEPENVGESASAFPTRLLSVTVLGTFGVLAWVSGYSFYSGNKFAVHSPTVDADQISFSFYRVALVTLIFATLLIGTWFFALRSIRVWRHELRSNRTLLRTILDHMPLALFAKDAARDYRWLLLNRKAEEMFGIKHSDVIGRPDSEFFPSEEAEFFRRTDEHVMAEGKLVDIEAEPVTTSKGTFTAHTIKVPIYDNDGLPHILLGMTEDVTERAAAKEELRLAKNKAEDSDRAKSEFLANMSHELRTPLNSILGTARLLQDYSGIAPDLGALVATISTSSTVLLEIVNDILDLSKIEAKALQLEKIGFDLNYVLDSVMDRMHALAREKTLQLIKAESLSLPFVLGDPTRLGRVLMNLISNAIKYTEHGSVRVTASHRVIDEAHILYRCEIADTGIGIPPEKYASIFEKFTQADTSTTRKYGGTGLGLAITKQLVELMGGTVGLHSVIGQGTTFWFEIDFAVTDKLHREKGGRFRLKQYSSIKPREAKILVAEDHSMNQLLIRRLMTKLGIAQFRIVSNGVEALEAYKEAPWDLILMDCHMPERNGYDTSVAIRAHEKATGGHTPIIAMTANAMVGDREKCLACGMDDYISKPLVLDELVRLMGQWLDLPGEGSIDEISGNTSSCVNLAQMRGFADGDVAMERELIHSFISQSDSNISLLAANCVDGPASAWVEAAHMLKGGAGGVGAEELSSLCALAQDMDTAAATVRTSLLLRIEDAYANVKQALQIEGLL